jgi:uroporphyrinogen-III synthase
MTDPTLAGRSVVVTRSRAQASSLVDRLRGLGATVVELPVIAIVDPADGGAALSDAAGRLADGAYQWVAVTSSNAASRLFAALDGRAVPSTVRWAAVGAVTARTLDEAGFPPALVPDVSMSEALARAFPAVPPGLHRAPAVPTGYPPTVLFPRAESVRGALAPELRAKGWVVDEVITYRTAADDPGPQAVAAARQADAIAFTSSSTVDRAVAVLTPGGVPPVVASIGPITSKTARAAGLGVAVEASVHTVEGLVDALVGALGAGSPTAAADPSGPW